MALRNVVKIGDDTLRKISKPVKNFDENLWVLLDDMNETMQKNDGMGLAAVQVGILRRVIVMQVNEAYFELINPEIIEQSGNVEDEEGCLSIPNKSGIVARPQKITVTFQDRFGTPMTITGEDAFARCACHEIDHLNGILYVDKMKEK